jgi:hypothetical protein
MANLKIVVILEVAIHLPIKVFHEIYIDNILPERGYVNVFSEKKYL